MGNDGQNAVLHRRFREELSVNVTFKKRFEERDKLITNY